MSPVRSVLSWVFALALCVPAYALAEEYVGDPSWDHPYDDPDHDWDHDGDHDWDHDGDHDGDHDWDHPYDHPDHECADYGPSDSSRPQEKLAAKFGVSEHRIGRLRDEGLGYGEIDHTLTLAERMDGGINSENVQEVLYMRQEQGMGWGQIAKAEGTTLGRAKQEFPTQPPVEPEPKPAATTDQTPTAQSPTLQPATKQTSTGQAKSLSRSGKSSYAVAGNSGSTKGFKGKDSMSRGGSSNRAVRTAAASSSPARSGGHAYGRGSSSGGSIGKANGGNGKAKGRK